MFAHARALSATIAAIVLPLQRNEPAKPALPLRQVASIELSGVEGRIDHLAIDLARRRLHVAALENGSLEVVDLKAEKRLKSISGLSRPQGILYLDAMDRVVVANGGSGMLDVLDGGSLERVASVKVGDDADNLRYDPRMKLVYVGWGDGALGIVDAREWKVTANVELSGHPESFQFDAKGERAFVNVADRHEIEIVDLSLRKVVDRWTLKDAEANFPMEIQGADRRLFVGCRKPPVLLVLDPKNGRRMDLCPLSGDADDIAFDEASGRVYVSCGAGSIDVLERGEKGEYKPAARIETAPGARTCLFVPGLERLFLAVPHRGGQRAEIRVFESVR